VVLFGRILYNILLIISLCFFIPVALVRKKWRKITLAQLGLPPQFPYPKRHPEKQAIWIHAVSAGEILSIVPIIKEIVIHAEDHNIVLTTFTQTGATLAQKLLGKYGVITLFFPFDLPFPIRQAITHIDPALVIVVEHDIWPNFLFELKRQKIPAILANAKLSRKTYTRRRLAKFFMGPVFASFSKICAQSSLDEERFKLLGVAEENIAITGNLKFDQQVYEPMPETERQQLRQALRLRETQKVFVAGSTHHGEEEMLVDVLHHVKSNFPNLTCVVAPRNPERADTVCQMFTSMGFSTVLLKNITEMRKSRSAIDVIIIDALGMLKKLYAISDVAFIGGSFVKRGGHNPIEPAAYAKPILFGPYMGNFEYIADLLLNTEGAIQAHDTQQISEIVCMLLKDIDKAQRMGENAFSVFQANSGAIEKTLTVINNCLP
jgi:3-deoxy-D-manno-octulosonic-acid transferase